MARIIIHQSKNFINRHYRYYNFVFEGLIEKLHKEFDCIDSRYYINAHAKHRPVKLLYDETPDDHTFYTLECEMIIENYDTQEIIGLSACDDLTTLVLKPHPKVTKILMAQYNKENIDLHLRGDEHSSKIVPWIYFPQTIQDYDSFYKKRQEVNLIDKFYFRGTSIEHRPILRYFDSFYFTGPNANKCFLNYAEEAINHKIGFSAAGRGEFCYRDIEYMAMGIPFMRFKYNNEMFEPLIPNYHYISVEWPDGVEKEHTLTEKHARAVEKRFIEVKDDLNFLNFISKNAREYYEKYIDLKNSIEHTYKLINIESWKNKL